jgi:DNA-binding transcriptional LysR family regulator
MIDELRAMAIFARTVETGSFRAAARELNLSPSVVSHHIAQLEARLGVALLYRSTRRLSLTHDGGKLLESARTVLQAAERGLNAIAGRSAEPSGRLSITVPVLGYSARGALIDDLAAFAQAYPKVALAINFSDEKRDLIRDGIDLAIRIGALKDSALKSKKLSVITRKLVAAPAYVAARKKPRRPADIEGWDWIGLSMRPNHKILISKTGGTHRIDFTPRITVDSIDAMCRLAVAGLGLVLAPAFLVDEDIRAGRLAELLPGWRVEALGVYAVWPSNAGKESLTYRLLRFLEARERERSGKN